MRTLTKNPLIYAEQVDLSSLHSIRLFATKWIDNSPPRRLDMLIFCANAMRYTSGAAKSTTTVDGLDSEWQINYLANFHLLSILSPALRAQPPDRDVRIIMSTCPSYIGSTLDTRTLPSRTAPSSSYSATSANPGSAQSNADENKLNAQKSAPNKDKNKHKASNKRATKSSTTTIHQPTESNMYATAKLALMILARSLQEHLSAYDRPDKHSNNAQVLLVDPGFSRTPGTRGWITSGSLWWLAFYLITWPLWWLILKSPTQGAQSYLMAAMEPGFSAEAVNAAAAAKKMGVDIDDEQRKSLLFSGRGVAGGKIIKDCMERDILRPEVMDLNVGKALWEFSERQIEQTEKEGAVRRALEKKEKAAQEAQNQRDKENEMSKKTTEKGNQPASRRSRKAK